MYKVTKEQFLLRQPSFPETEATDSFYYDLCNQLVKSAIDSGIVSDIPEAVTGRVALCVIGYLQDVVADGGVWRSFINECRRLYGRTLPFFETSEEYIDYELNGEDVRFLIWYAISMYYEPARLSYPLDEKYSRLAALWMEILSEKYEEAPIPEGYTKWRETEPGDPEDRKKVYELANWLFMHCYLMTPAFALTLNEIVAMNDPKNPDHMLELQKSLEQAMYEVPTGPMAFYTAQWVHLILTGSLPTEPKTEPKEQHKFHKAVTEYTGGKEIVYFDTYDNLNKFFIDVIGWEAGKEHLEAMKKDKDFVILVNHDKGMLVARNVAKCIADPANPYYNKEDARKYAIKLLTERGVCPPDLRFFITERGWLPDAVFPGTEDYRLVAENQDFIARCWLQLYYNGD